MQQAQRQVKKSTNNQNDKEESKEETQMKPFNFKYNHIKKFNILRFTRKQKLGEGSYGVVLHMFDKQLEKDVAIKKLKNQEGYSEGIPYSMLREISMLRQLRGSKHIVELYEIFWHQDSFILSLEFAENGDLFHYLQNNQRKLSNDQIRSIIRQILKAVEYMHSKGVIHRDLKTSNILVCKDLQIKIADFGLGRYSRHTTLKMTREVQSLWYRAPEILLGNVHYSYAVDYWTVGLMIYEICYGQPLFKSNSEIGMLFEIFKVKGTPNPNKFEYSCDYPEFNSSFSIKFPKFEKQKLPVPKFRQPVSKDIELIIEGMTELDPQKRMSTDLALKILL